MLEINGAKAVESNDPLTIVYSLLPSEHIVRGADCRECRRAGIQFDTGRVVHGWRAARKGSHAHSRGGQVVQAVKNSILHSSGAASVLLVTETTRRTRCRATRRRSRTPMLLSFALMAEGLRSSAAANFQRRRTGVCHLRHFINLLPRESRRWRACHPDVVGPQQHHVLLFARSRKQCRNRLRFFSLCAFI
jgi:hypothetical protein